jgi:serine/threonine protein phosphatase PrpC
VAGILAVTRAIGDAKLKPYVTSKPEVREVNVAAGDVILIASDGLWDEVTRERVCESLGKGKIHQLVESIAPIGEDNITVMVVDVTKALASLAVPALVAPDDDDDDKKKKKEGTDGAS